MRRSLSAWSVWMVSSTTMLVTILATMLVTMLATIIVTMLATILTTSCGGDDDVATPPVPYEPEPFEPTDATRAYCRSRSGGADDDAVEARITELLAESTTAGAGDVVTLSVDWALEPLDYTLDVGTSSRDLPLAATLTVLP